jgi:hypothetical protein
MEGAIMLLEELRCEVELALDRGQSVTEVSSALIDPAGWLGEDEQAALWLFAWSYPARSRRGAEHLLKPIAS